MRRHIMLFLFQGCSKLSFEPQMDTDGHGLFWRDLDGTTDEH